MYKKLVKNRTDISNADLKTLTQLHKTPIRETKEEMPVFQNFKANFTHQADLLYLPTAVFGYKFLLVVVDNHTRHFDAEPIKKRDSGQVAKAFEKIYSRIDLPKRIEVDDGSEFKSQVKTYFEEHDVEMRVAQTNRHRQEGLVESRNGVLGKLIMMILNVKELKNKKTSKDWFKNMTTFRSLIDELNENIQYQPQVDDIQENIRVSENNKELLPQGTEVRVQLDYPIDLAKEKRMFGKFRAGDIRWSTNIKTIEWNVLQPNQPPMYKVNGESILRTRQQLQVVRLPRFQRA
jgi:hypothetical protein